MNVKTIYVLLILSFLICLAPQVKGEEKTDIRESLAEAYIMDRDYENAIKQYREILKENPDNVKARSALADTLSWQKKYDQAIREYENALRVEPDNIKIKEKLAKVYLWKSDYAKAEEICKDILKKDSQNLDAKVLLADIFAYSKNFKQAISLYEEVLKEKDDLEIKRKLADVLSWDKQYALAINFYDETLSHQEDKEARLQKARILGWQRQYVASIEEYRKILKESYDEKIELEMEAKIAYWNNSVKQAISYYTKLIARDPENVEARFDLSQVYSYQNMWEEAINQYQRILEVSPTHFRAKESLEKVNLISSHTLFTTGYEFFEADSNSRSEDINRHSFFNQLSIPFNYHLNFDVGYRLTSRAFSDFKDVLENKAEIRFSYLQMPDWTLDGYYGFIEYNRGIDSLHLFGTQFLYRIFNTTTSAFSFERKQLENTSKLIRDRYYNDNYKQRFELDVDKRLKLGADYLFSYYSDANFKHEPGFDMLYFLMLDPKRLAIRYRYFYREFDKKRSEYFSPKGFSTNIAEVNWRHFLNKEEIFFGADNLYYDLGYGIAIDSKDIVSHRFSAELNWDINKRLNFKIKASATNSSASVYEDGNLTTSIHYYF